ncbi:MAG: CAP domain-containing protein [Nitrospirota bacterium]
MQFIISICVILMTGWMGCSSVIYESLRLDKSHSKVTSIIKPINEARARGFKCGNRYYRATHPVAWNDKIAQASLYHSLDMAQNGFLSHKGTDGSDPGQRLLRADYKWSGYGEDIGQGYRTPEEAVQAWLKSETHCKNIMNPQFKEAGASYAKSDNQRTYWTLILGRQR